jgi:hypothetical protein
MKYEDIEVGDIVILELSAISYSDDGSDIVDGYHHYINKPCKITQKRKKRKVESKSTEFGIDGKFGVFAKDIKMKLTPEEYPEYYI